jgi:hypothetical protein
MTLSLLSSQQVVFFPATLLCGWPSVLEIWSHSTTSTHTQPLTLMGGRKVNPGFSPAHLHWVGQQHDLGNGCRWLGRTKWGQCCSRGWLQLHFH